MRFKKYMYKHLGDQGEARARARVVNHVTGSGSSDKFRKTTRRNDPATTTQGVSMRPSGDCVARRGGATAGDGSHGVARRQLLEKKKGILLELKGVVSRQAEALDRLAEGHNTDDTQRRSMGRTDRQTVRARVTPHFVRTVPSTGETSTRNSPTVSSTTGRSTLRTTPHVLPTPPQSATAAFLAQGGRWGGQGRNVAQHTRKSAASSASYATYCERGRDRGGAVPLAGRRRPGAVPALPIGGRVA